jgi:Tfp pilus assembly protein PilF
MEEVRVLLERGDLDSARELLGDVVAASPLAPEPYVELARVHRALNDINSAIHELKRAVSLDPSSAEAHLHLGLLLAERCDYDGAIRAFRAVVMLISSKERPTPEESGIRRTAADQVVRLLQEGPA